MELEMTETVRSTPSRHEKSLGLLTMKFVSLLQEAKDGVLDLKVAADSLAVRQKRRIYDITNVLEGVGLIEKKNKNIIQWRGENSGSQTQEVLEQLKVLKAQISELEAQEKELDLQKAWLDENNTHLNHDPITSPYPFMPSGNICNAFSRDTLLAVMAPAGTQLEVPLPETGQSGQKRYQVNLRSHSAPIQVMLINRDSDSSIPVVFSVPPIDDIYHQMVLPDHDDALTPTSTPPDMQMECHVQSAVMLGQQMDLGSEFQSVLDGGSLLKLSTAGDHLKDDRDGAVDLIDELMSAEVIDYSFNLDDNEGVCDLFDVQILNY
ncbi:hypothetical protein KUCAC02_018559 [Chaenocephalus aceratus]|uniref:Uncharacterized protein n=1 Tax=Chaenocephalus aceratus TaxID=36190 RepID=A0ACB9W9R0_CHAAC|nr:hypothetical protein KUCAC02_018559 [Chaenocephalus aceratus]